MKIGSNDEFSRSKSVLERKFLFKEESRLDERGDLDLIVNFLTNECNNL